MEVAASLVEERIEQVPVHLLRSRTAGACVLGATNAFAPWNAAESAITANTRLNALRGVLVVEEGIVLVDVWAKTSCVALVSEFI